MLTSVHWVNQYFLLRSGDELNLEKIMLMLCEYLYDFFLYFANEIW